MFVPCIPRPQKIEFLDGTISSQEIVYTLNSTLEKEHYKIVADNNIEVFYADARGLQYAKKTLKDFCNYYGDFLPKMNIEDGPKYYYRGLMLDVGRYFYPVKDVKKIIDYMADINLNVFHFHLTEDQGWRIESEKYPLLTKIGSHRTHTNFNRKPHGGFYTKAELKDIVAYCHERNIIVIPEIDIPGHTRSAIAAYPQLACLQRELPVATHFGVKHDILCAGKEFTYTFVKDIIEEFLEIFTDGYFHLGGDEAVKTRWKLCPECQKVIKDMGLADEYELQTYFLNRIIKEVLLPRNVKPLSWKCGDNAKGLDPSMIVQYYEGVQTTMDTTYTLINSNSEYLYLDFPYVLSTLEDSYNAIQKDPTTDISIGLESCVWTEFIKDLKKAEYMMFPRLLAHAENMWGSQNDFDEFLTRAQLFYKTHDSKNFCPIQKASPKNLKFFRSFHWNVLRPMCWEGLHNNSDNKKVEKLFKEKANQ